MPQVTAISWEKGQRKPIGAALRLLDLIGEETLMWGSDFPHPDGVWPDSQTYIHKQFSGLPEEVRHRIICGNAVDLYKLQS